MYPENKNQQWQMNAGTYNADQQSVVASGAFIQKVFSWMAIALGITL